MNSEAMLQSQGSSARVIYEAAYGLLQAETGSLLDLGCGGGAFLSFLREKGRSAEELTGCDGYEYPGVHDAGSRFVQTDLNQPLPFLNDSFSVVSAIEVIEHLENPRALAREIIRILAPGGLAVISTPNNESITSLLSLAVRGKYSAFSDSCYPAHITPLLQVDLERIMKEAGFTELQFSWTRRGRIPGTGVHWQSVSGGWLGGKRFSDNILVSGRKPQ